MTPPARPRPFWSAPLTMAGVGEGHDHRFTTAAKIGLAVIAVIAVAGAVLGAALWWHLLLSDAADEERREEFRRNLCDVLELFPPDPVTDDVRGEYGCGPGRPIADFPPDVREQITRSPRPAEQPAPQPTPEPEPAAEPVPPTPLGGAVPDPPRSTPYVPAPGEEPVPPQPTPTPEAAPAPDPLLDLAPVTDLADDLLCPLICLTEETP